MVLVTNLSHAVSACAQLYRDRGDCENPFDELKNQWGWSGFTTHDFERSQIMLFTPWCRILTLLAFHLLFPGCLRRQFPNEGPGDFCGLSVVVVDKEAVVEIGI